MEERRNPYTTVLLIFALIGLLGGAALTAAGVFSSSNQDGGNQLLLVSIGTSALVIGGSFLLLWISVSAITWSISQAANRQLAARGANNN